MKDYTHAKLKAQYEAHRALQEDQDFPRPMECDDDDSLHNWEPNLTYGEENDLSMQGSQSRAAQVPERIQLAVQQKARGNKKRDAEEFETVQEWAKRVKIEDQDVDMENIEMMHAPPFREAGNLLQPTQANRLPAVLTPRAETSSIILSGFECTHDAIKVQIPKVLQRFNPISMESSNGMRRRKLELIWKAHGLEPWTNFVIVVLANRKHWEAVRLLDGRKFTWTPKQLMVDKYIDAEMDGFDEGKIKRVAAPAQNNQVSNDRTQKRKVWVTLLDSILKAREELKGEDLEVFEAVMSKETSFLQARNIIDDWAAGGNGKMAEAPPIMARWADLDLSG